MPLSDNVDHVQDDARRLQSVSGHNKPYPRNSHSHRHQSKGGKTILDVSDSASRAGNKGSSGRRLGILLDLQDTSSSLLSLSPILSHFSSLSHMPSLSIRGFLPLPESPAKQQRPSSVSGERSKHDYAAEGSRAVWQQGDLYDGRGVVPILLITSKAHALQIFVFPNNVIPSDPHVPETFPSPEEACSIPQILYDEKTQYTTLPGTINGDDGWTTEHVLSCKLLKGNPEPLVAFTTIKPLSRRATSLGAVALVIVSLRTGIAVRRVDLGTSSAAEVFSSSRILAVTISHPTPSIHLFHPTTFALLSPPLTELPANPRTSLPVISIYGRLLAYTTSEAPHAPGPEGLGSIVTASSLRAAQHRSSSSSSRTAERRSSSHEHAQPALLSSAVEIGGGVARGVWAGIKMGAKVAERARNSRLARSAPADSGSGGFADGEDDEIAESESRSLDNSSVFDESPSPAAPGGSWIKIMDLDHLLRTEHTTPSSSRSTPPAETIAHFRLPIATSSSPLDNAAGVKSSPRRSSETRAHPVIHLSFSPSGTRLLAAPSDGKSFHLLDIRPAGVLKSGLGSSCKGEVWHQYELRRGHTSSTVSSVSWDKSGRWIGVGTDRGTIHVFPVTPDGGLAKANTHASLKMVNSQQLPGLSTVVSPLARLRPARAAVGSPGLASPELAGEKVDISGATFGFFDLRRHPVSQEQFCQDIGVYRSVGSTFEMLRMSVHAERPVITSGSLQARGSALTEMMRAKTFGEHGDLGVDVAVKARWALPMKAEGLVTLSDTLEKSPRRLVVNAMRSKSLAQAEIQTHCLNTRILPSAIYLSRQVEFFAARPIDEYSPLSMIDLEARSQRLVFHHEVEARSASPLIKSFDEPLSTALHSIIESRPVSQIPGLPNGYPSRAKWHNSIPVRSVTAGLNESVDRVRREYVRAQHSRNRRRTSEAAANQLSFEDDAEFLPSNELEGEGEGEDQSGSSPSSGMLPTNTESSVDDREGEGEDEWGDKWEEEYRKAVEDDGAPEELVLGLMDEEEEERRQWEIRQKALAKKWAK